MESLFSQLTRKRAQELSLLFTAQEIPHEIDASGGCLTLLVPQDLHAMALEMVTHYDAENREKPLTSPWVLTPSWSGLFGALILLTVFLKTGSLEGHEETVRLFAASASRILSGEWFRTITALFLHSGWPHLLGNMAGLIIFGTGVFQISGDGVGWFMLLIASLLANWVNAFWFTGMGHVSFGASTLVFAAAGLLASAGSLRRLIFTGLSWRAFLPLGAGISILALSGVGPGSDVTGHLLGFLFGLLFGVVPGLLPRKLEKNVQWAGLALSSALCSLAFFLGSTGVI